jgi:signal transduction histidine kinase
MRTPLSVIRMTVETLAGAGARTRRPEARDILKRQATHLARLIDDLLDGSLVGGGEFKLATSRVDLDGVIASAVDACRPTLLAKHQRLHVRPAPRPSASSAIRCGWPRSSATC